MNHNIFHEVVVNLETSGEVLKVVSFGNCLVNCLVRWNPQGDANMRLKVELNLFGVMKKILKIRIQMIKMSRQKDRCLRGSAEPTLEGKGFRSRKKLTVRKCSN